MSQPVYTYFEDFSGTGRRSAILDIWARSWAEHGWDPIVLGREDAKAHPDYGTFLAAIGTYPTVNNPAYEEACYLRWMALAAVGGAVMTDTDVLNFGLYPDDRRLEGILPGLGVHGIVCLDRWWVPCAMVLPTEDDRADLLNLLASREAVEAGVIQVDGKRHVSDMTILQKTTPGRRVPLCDLHPARLSLRHFASVASGGPAGKLETMSSAYEQRTEADGAHSAPPNRHVSWPHDQVEWRRSMLLTLVETQSQLIPPGLQGNLVNADLGQASDALQVHRSLRKSHQSVNADLWKLVVEAMTEKGLLAYWTRRDLVRLMLGRGVGPHETWVETDRPEALVERIFGSLEWNLRFPALARSTVDRGRWTYLVHLPKTGGSALETAFLLSGRPFGVVRVPGASDSGPIEAPLTYSLFTEALQFGDSPRLTVSGHRPAFEMLPGLTQSPLDDIYAVVREPIQQVLSLANFYLDGLSVDDTAPDRFWRSLSQDVPSSVDEIDLDAFVAGIATHIPQLLPSRYLQRPGLSLTESIAFDRINVLRQERLNEEMFGIVPDGYQRLVDAGIERTINQSSGQLRAGTFSSSQWDGLVNACHELIVEHQVLTARA